jgi:ATP-binding cassette subfamily C protein
MSTPSIFSAIQKLKSLLTREEKFKWFGIAAFALCTSLLEIVTASIIVVFAQVLNAPEVGQKYLSKLGFSDNLPASRVVFIVAIACGAIYFIKNCIAAIEVFYQNFSIQKMNYNFKNKLLRRYAQTEYAFHLTRNSALGIQVVSSDAELTFSRGMIAVANILSEGIVFSCLVSMIIYMNPSLAITVFGIGTVLLIIISKGLLPLFYRWGKKLQEASVYAGQSLMQFFHAFKEILLLGKREAFVKSYECHSFKKYKIHAIHNSTNALPRMVIEMLFVVLFVTAVACMCAKNEASAQMLGVLGGYLYVGFRLMPG